MASEQLKPGRLRPAQNRRLAVTERDQCIVRNVWRFRLLSRDHIMTLAPFTSLTRANTRLAQLVRARLLARKQVPFYPGKGSAQLLYYNGVASHALLGLDRLALRSVARRISHWDQSRLAHALAANDFLIRFCQSVEQVPQATLITFQTEPELRDQFNRDHVVPDGWVAWIQGGKRFNCFIEADLGHETLGQWRQKVSNYILYAEAEHHEEVFGFRFFRVLVVVPGATRREHLRRIAQPADRLFLFADLNTLVGMNLLLRPTWWPAEASAPIALIEA